MHGNKFFVDRFFEMESKYNLFALRDNKGRQIWDILRFDIYLYYTFGVTEGKYRRSLIKGLLVCINGGLRLILSLFHTFFFKADVVIFENPRYKDSKGYVIDQAIEDIYTAEKRRKVCVSKYKALQRFPHYIEYDFCEIYGKYIHKRVRVDDDIKIKIAEALASLSLESPNKLIDDVYNRFDFEYNYYRWYVKMKDPRVVLFNRDAIKKGLICAVNDLKIPIYEIQHGMFSKNHLAYSYPQNVCMMSDDIIVPQKLFTFDESWGRGINVPFMMIPIGNNYFACDDVIKKKIETNVERNALLVISSKVHAEQMIPIVSEFARLHPDVNVIYKLHPNEYSYIDVYKTAFNMYHNINVVAGERQIKDLLLFTRLVFLINSTIFYEALSYGVDVAVYLRMNYDSYAEFLDKGIVEGIDDIDDLCKAYKCSKKGISKNYSFFKRFDADRYSAECI